MEQLKSGWILRTKHVDVYVQIPNVVMNLKPLRHACFVLLFPFIDRLKKLIPRSKGTEWAKKKQQELLGKNQSDALRKEQEFYVNTQWQKVNCFWFSRLDSAKSVSVMCRWALGHVVRGQIWVWSYCEDEKEKKEVETEQIQSKFDLPFARSLKTLDVTCTPFAILVWPKQFRWFSCCDSHDTALGLHHFTSETQLNTTKSSPHLSAVRRLNH